MERYHELMEDFGTAARLVELNTSHQLASAELAARYYFPYYLMVQIGYSFLYNRASTCLTSAQQLSIDTMAMEVSLVVGTHHEPFDRLHMFAGAGPSVFFFVRSEWDLTYGGIADVEADPGFGTVLFAGADYMLASWFSLGLELRYRYLRTDDVKSAEGDASSGGKYDIDFSGVGVSLAFRFYVL
jgi:outer membrane protein W